MPNDAAAPTRTVCYAVGTDLDASRHFYTKILGLELAMEDPILGFVSPANRSAQILTPPADFDQPQPSFGVDLGHPAAVDAAHAAAVDRGLRVVYPLTEEPWGVRRFFVEDPGGTIVNVLAHIPDDATPAANGASRANDLSNAHVRIARPSADLAQAERFYAAGLGVDVLYRADDGSEPNQLLMLGWPGASWHLELTHHNTTPTPPSPSADDLLVLYLDGPVPDSLISDLEAAGGRRVAAENPYWDRWGVTVQDPDGYRLVLCTRGWGSGAG